MMQFSIDSIETIRGPNWTNKWGISLGLDFACSLEISIQNIRRSLLAFSIILALSSGLLKCFPRSTQFNLVMLQKNCKNMWRSVMSWLESLDDDEFRRLQAAVCVCCNYCVSGEFPKWCSDAFCDQPYQAILQELPSVLCLSLFSLRMHFRRLAQSGSHWGPLQKPDTGVYQCFKQLQ